MSDRYDPRERWRWEEEREREDQGLESERRFARHGGDPRWGTGGMSAGRPLPRPARGAARRPDVRGPYVGYGPRGYRRTDERIFEDLCERLTEHGDIDATDIEVTVSGGEATLSGTVATRSQKRLAEDVVDRISGVTEVHNQLRIQRAGDAVPRASPPGGDRGRDEGSSAGR
jgi:BON domain